MDTAIIIAIIGGAGGFISALTTAIVKFCEWRKAQRTEDRDTWLDNKLSPITKTISTLQATIDELQKELREIRLDTTRVQMMDLIHDEPHNHDTILTVAHRYLIELKGNWVGSVELQEWADHEKIHLPIAIQEAIAKNDSQK